MKFVITTQVMENYGAHTGDGKFSSGNAYWKMKGGTDYVVEGLTRIQDAVAFVMAKFSENDLGYKEFPVKFSTFEEWEDALLIDTDQDYRDYITSCLVHVSPN